LPQAYRDHGPWTPQAIPYPLQCAICAHQSHRGEHNFYNQEVQCLTHLRHQMLSLRTPNGLWKRLRQVACCHNMGTNAGISSTTGGTPDTQFFHLRLKGGAFEAENLGGTTAARKAQPLFCKAPRMCLRSASSRLRFSEISEDELRGTFTFRVLQQFGL